MADQENGRWRSSAPVTANGAPAFPNEWNASALLNPRGPGQSRPQHPPPPRSQNGYGIPHTPPPPLQFQFDSPGPSPFATHHSHPVHQQGNPPFDMNGNGNALAHYGNGDEYDKSPMGMGSFVERAYNVTDRDMLPQKRRKTQDDRSEVRNKIAFNGGGKGGVLGTYMQEMRAEGRKEASANGTKPPDISFIEDDDDVVTDVSDKEVSYGRLEGAWINAHKVPTARPGATTVSTGYWPQVKIVLKRRFGDRTNIISVSDSTRTIIGCLDTNTSIGLAPLLDSDFSLRTAARILTRLKKPEDLEPGTEGVSSRYPLDLVLYGPRKHAVQIGKHLSQKNLFLRTPLFVEAGIELYIPQSFQKPQELQGRAVASYGSRSSGPTRSVEEIKNDVLNMFDSLVKSADLPEMDPDPRILTPLLKHQKQGLFFMISKEKPRIFGREEKDNSSLWRLNIGASGERSYYNIITQEDVARNPPEVLGGILADMMGLGKTLSILSLVVTTLDTDAAEWAKLEPCTQDDRDLQPVRKGKKALPPIEQTPLVLNCKTTLLVSPLSVISNWEEQIKQHVKPGTLRYHIYHGTNRIKDASVLATYDLVITTYGSVASEFNNRSRKKAGKFPLEQMNWFRIVLDEAHMIREQSTQQSKAICRLAANRRWAVTGTPVQNRLDDLGALMTFLRIKPFDEKGGFAQYIMSPFKMCDPEILPKLRLLVDTITLRRLKDRIDLPKRYDRIIRLDFNLDERALYDIFAKNASDKVKVITGQKEKSLGGKSYVHILQSILRLRLICAHGRDLLNDEDLKVMEGLSKDSAIDLDSDDDDNKPALSSQQAYSMLNLMKETNADNCLSCNRKIGPNDAEVLDLESKEEVIGYMTPCFHVYCKSCIGDYKTTIDQIAQGSPQAYCPTCHQYIRVSYFPLKQDGVDKELESRLEARGATKNVEIDGYNGPHTKTKALITDLLASTRESALMPDEPPIKSVIFSGWTSHLDLIQIALEQNDIKYTRLDGKMSRVARGTAMNNFRQDPSILVILVSIMAGGLGLNLTTANKVYVMEPQYNPAAEAQAVDRVHRLGQKREVETVRYIMNDSFEEKMLELQEKKKALASLSMDAEGSMIDKRNRGQVKQDAARKRLEELRSLFK